MFSDFSSPIEMMAVLVGIAAPSVTLTKARREGNRDDCSPTQIPLCSPFVKGDD
jgi:hypothetical protein